MHLAAETELGIFVGLDDAGFRFAQRGENFLHAVADRGDDPHAGHDHTFHGVKFLGSPRRFAAMDQTPAGAASPAWNSPTLKSLAV